MASIRVRFEWLTGVRRTLFDTVRLSGSWDESGRYADAWAATAMSPFVADDGCPAWATEVDFDATQAGWTFHWGVLIDVPGSGPSWGIPTEEPDGTGRRLSFALAAEGHTQRYWLTHSRRLGANKATRGDGSTGIRLSVLAPNAQTVELVTGDPVSGYIHDDGRDVRRVFAMTRDQDGVWSTTSSQDFSLFEAWDHVPYMFRITRDDGSVRFRTDLYSRCQIGSGRQDPEPPPPAVSLWNGTRDDLKGTKGCSVVIDPERVTALLNDPAFPPTNWLDDAAFWAEEFDPLRPVPDRLEELIIYELHVEGLVSGSNKPGTFAQAIALLDYLVDLGINAVELLPAAEAEAWTWGYGTSHHFATEYAAGGRDNFKHFVRACHRRGIAVLLDVVYNHFITPDAERSEWLYDTAADEKTPYYWYEGRRQDWSQPDGGYLDNGSTGFTPNFRSEWVRKLFTSSAVAWLTEFHLDGFRVDLTQAMHRDNARHADKTPVPEANRFGAKLLREWVRTLRLIKPSVLLTAEDHTGWRAITQPQAVGGIGFDAAWWADYYHNLIGDSQNNLDNARLIYEAGLGSDGPLAMGRFAATLAATSGRVIYHESHDQAGNATYNIDGREVASARTIMVAVNNHLDAASRPWAEARCRVAAGLTLTAPGVPMFFMGEEVGAREPYRYFDWIVHREDFRSLRAGEGAHLFAFYRDVIALRRGSEALRTGNVVIVHTHDAKRVLSFRRTTGEDDLIVVASLNNAAFADGYWFESGAIPDGAWTTALNSDAHAYGGRGMGNEPVLVSSGSRLNLRVPANSLQILRRL